MSNFKGVVTDPNGATLNGGNMWVWAYCANYPPGAIIGGSLSSWTSTSTSSSGHYSLGEPYWYDNQNGNDEPCTADGGGGYAVQIANYPISVDNMQVGNALWVGHWNETIITYAPQYLNFYLPTNFMGPMVPLVLDFTGDSAVAFDYASGLASQTQSSWSFDGFSGSSTVTTGKLTSLSTQNNPGTNLEYYARFYVTGSTTFNAISRQQPVINSWSYVGGPLSPSNNPNQATDPITPFYNTAETNEVCYSVYPGAAAITETSTYSQSYVLTSGFNLNIAVGVDLGGGVSMSADVLNIQNTISNGGGQSWTLSYILYVPSTGTTHYVWVYVQPGTTNQVGPVAHAWSGPKCP
jgi:hypothetical protein